MAQLDIAEFMKSGFDLREHLSQFLKISTDELEIKLSNGLENMSNLHPGSLSSDNISSFYEDEVGSAHLFDLAAWHLGSSKYIADTLRLEKLFVKGKVLDFGGGIGTHSIAAASQNEVEHVYFVDINPQNRSFVEHRAKILGLSDLISTHRDIHSTRNDLFDSIICLDVLEHLPDPSSQVLEFKKALHPDSIALLNWYFFKGFNGEYPFHFDEKDIVDKFFETLQTNFIEVFHPFLITARSYKPIQNSTKFST